MEENLLKKYPNVAKKMSDPNHPVANEIENVFYLLAKFIKDKDSFDLKLLDCLKGEELQLALKTIVMLFQDSLKEPFYLIKEGDIYSQKMFTDYLNSLGLKYTIQKLNTYYDRGIIPKAELMINNRPFWLKDTVIKYGKIALKEEKEKKLTGRKYTYRSKRS
jgi:hypothetical protein